MLFTRVGGALYWKVPGRSIACHSFGSWVHAILWCYVVLRYFRADLAIYEQAAVDHALGIGASPKE
jgi:hypothetical protein